MTKIKNFNTFITEKLGISEIVLKLADEIFPSLEGKKYFEWKGTLEGNNITLEIFPYSELQNGTDGLFRQLEEENHFQIKLSKPNKSNLVHELKHLHRFLVWKKKKGIKVEKHQIFKSSVQISNKYGYLFKDKSHAQLLPLILYYSETEEFEAYYNGLYFDLIEKTRDKTKKEIREIIDEELNEHIVFGIYKLFYDSPFDIKTFFKSNKDMNMFFERTNEIVGLLFLEKDERENSIITYLKFLSSEILKFFKLGKREIKPSQLYKEFNNLVNKSIQKNYHKFFRLYTLFDC